MFSLIDTLIKMQLIINFFFLTVFFCKACMYSFIYSADTYSALCSRHRPGPWGCKDGRCSFLEIKYLKDPVSLAVHSEGLSYAKCHEKN